MNRRAAASGKDLAARLNGLRAAVLGANDGIVSVAAAVVRGALALVATWAVGSLLGASGLG